MDVLRAQAIANGFFTRTDALAQGMDDRSIRRVITTRAWHRIRNGAYTMTDLWPDDPLLQHVIRSRAAMAKLGDAVVLSHTSGAVLHGLSLWEPDLSAVHVTRLDGSAGHREAGVIHHEGLTLPGDMMIRAGIPVMNPARAALEAASLCNTEGAVVVLDSALHLGLTSADELASTYALMQSWPGFRRLQVAVRLADGRAESVGESRSRYLFYLQHLPAPELQFVVRNNFGDVVGTCDFGWPEHRLLGEFDGRVKYERYLRPGEKPGDAVFREKRREDLLCEVTGWRMVRLVWADLYDAPRTAARIRRLLRDVA
jgi:hypothetical protein